MDDNGFRLLPGPEQAVQILMVMKDVTAHPVDQTNIGIGRSASVIVEFRVRIQQQVGNPGNRNDIVNRVGTAVECGPGNTRGRVSDRSDGRVAIAKPSAGEADLSQHGGQGDSHPIALLAMIRPLEGPGYRDQRALGGHPPSQRGNRLSLQTGDTGRPVRILGLSIAFAHEIRSKPLKADTVPRQELVIGQPLFDQGMGQTEHQRHVGIGARGQPFGP